jgi:hypothetical protein
MLVQLRNDKIPTSHKLLKRIKAELIEVESQKGRDKIGNSYILKVGRYAGYSSSLTG